MQEVVITGIGVVSPIGTGLTSFANSLRDQRSGIRQLDCFDPSALAVRLAGQVEDFEPKQFVRPRKSLKVMSRDIQIAYSAAAQACEHAGIGLANHDPDRLGVIFGADLMYGDLSDMTSAVKACTIDGRFRSSEWGTRAMQEMYPLWMLKYLPNMLACHIGIAHDARGPNNSIVQGEVSSLLAIQEGMRTIERGSADVMIVGGGSSSRLHPMAMIARSDALFSHRNDNPTAALRPFDADRDGTVYGEGAAAVVLESRSHAQQRNATVLARLLGYASACEPVTEAHELQGTAIRLVLEHALSNAGMAARDVGHINAHGAGTLLHDAIEAQAIRSVLDEVPVTAPKSYFGNLGAAAGAVEMVASLISFESGRIPVTLNYATPDPECPVCVVHGEEQRWDHPTAVLLSHTTTGQAASVVLAAP